MDGKRQVQVGETVIAPLPATETTASRTVAALGAAVNAELAETYTLVYAEHDRYLPMDMVAALVKGENDLETKGGENLMDWADEVAAVAAREAVDKLARDIVARWEREDDAGYQSLVENEWPFSDEQEEAITTVRDRDRSTWFDDMVKSHGKVLLRVGIATMDEDAGISHAPLTYEAFLDLLGFDHTEQNLERAAEVVDNASPEFSVAMGYTLLGADLADILSLPREADRKIELRNPHVWLGNPFAGSGWCSEEPFAGTLTVYRGDLRTDDDAFGYSWGQVGGGTDPKYFSSGSLAVSEPEPLALGTAIERGKHTDAELDTEVIRLARGRGWVPHRLDAEAALAWLNEDANPLGFEVVRDADGVHVQERAAEE